jgi:hypothetical protein
MALNYPPFVVLTSHFRVTGGHDLNPSAQTLQAEDQQLFSAFNQITIQVMTQAGVGADLLPLIVALASMAPGVSPTQRVQLATLFVRNAMASLNQPAPALSAVMLPVAGRRRRATGARTRPVAKKAAAKRKKKKPRLPA